MKKILLSMICLAFAGIAMAQNATLPQNITIKTLDGTSVQTSAIQNDGKPIILSFWATWCKPCNRELNTIKEVYEEWQEETGVKLVAVSIDDARSAARVKPHVDGNGWEYEEPGLQTCHECSERTPHLCDQRQRGNRVAAHLICGRQRRGAIGSSKESRRREQIRITH